MNIKHDHIRDKEPCSQTVHNNDEYISFELIYNIMHIL